MRNPSWVEDELLIVLDLYLSKRRVLEENDPLVIAASELLNQLPIHPQAGQPGFRTPDAVVLRLANFRSYDPSSSAKGMSNAGRRAGEVWHRYARGPITVHRLVQAIERVARSTYDVSSLAATAGEEGVPEGRLLYRLHRRRERDPHLRARKMKQLTAEGQVPRCDACELTPASVYGPSCDPVLQCHHLDPLAHGERTTLLMDVAVLCANCHTAIHARGLLVSVDELRDSLPVGYRGMMRARAARCEDDQLRG